MRSYLRESGYRCVGKYQGVEQLIYRGFLTTKISTSDVHIVLKSINPKELQTVQEKTPLKTHPEYGICFESIILSYAIYMIDGENVLNKRPDSLDDMAGIIRDLPTSLKTELMGELLVLQKAQDTELKRLEAYSYEPESRYIWNSYRGRLINDPALTGISGTDILGLNSHQMAWIYLNIEEDNRERSEELWGYTKFIASATNPKGVKKIDQQDRGRLKQLQEERDRIRLGLEYHQGVQRIERRSVEDLRAQLQADLEGKQDLHDQIVSSYETSIQERRRQRQMLEEEKMKQIKEMKKDLDLSDGDGYYKVYSTEQIKEMRTKQADETINWAKKQFDNRTNRAQEYGEDKKYASQVLQNKYIQEITETFPEQEKRSKQRIKRPGPEDIQKDFYRNTNIKYSE